MELKQSYFELYGDNEITQYRWDQLQEIIAGAKAARSPELKKQDKGGNSGILRHGFLSQRERLRKCMS